MVLIWIGLFILLPGPLLGADLSFLSPDEQGWLKERGRAIRLGPEANYPPLSYLDADGVWRGLSADMAHLVADRLGVRFQLLESANLATLLDAAKAGKVEILTSIKPTPERSRYLTFTPPYVNIPTAILSRHGDFPGATLEELHGKRVAVGNGYGVHEYLRTQHPEIHLDPVEDDLHGLQKLAFGGVDAVIMDMASATWFLEQEKITNLRVVGRTDYEYALSFGIRNGVPELATILAKSLAAIPPPRDPAGHGSL
ncbi:MAG: transporter substrate-binding domain-containing protein, partial [Magnetococcales bacterium]|nr:transporter substrate-binding domain-containing protein [Magnetococcales bacterium]